VHSTTVCTALALGFRSCSPSPGQLQEQKKQRSSEHVSAQPYSEQPSFLNKLASKLGTTLQLMNPRDYCF
jgi:hypothetical protein